MYDSVGSFPADVRLIKVQDLLNNGTMTIIELANMKSLKLRGVCTGENITANVRKWD